MKIKDYEYKLLTKEKIRNYARAFFTVTKALLPKLQNASIDLNHDCILKLFQTYDKIAFCIKEDKESPFYGTNIDSHKISAIFVMVLLKHTDVFRVKKHIADEIPFLDALPMYFSIYLGIQLMEGLYNDNNKSNQLNYKIDDNYVLEYVKMVRANHSTIIASALNEECNSETDNRVFCLSHLFYQIERNLEKIKKEL